MCYIATQLWLIDLLFIIGLKPGENKEIPKDISFAVLSGPVKKKAQMCSSAYDCLHFYIVVSTQRPILQYVFNFARTL